MLGRQKFVLVCTLLNAWSWYCFRTLPRRRKKHLRLVQKSSFSRFILRSCLVPTTCSFGIYAFRTWSASLLRSWSSLQCKPTVFMRQAFPRLIVKITYNQHDRFSGSLPYGNLDGAPRHCSWNDSSRGSRGMRVSHIAQFRTIYFNRYHKLCFPRLHRKRQWSNPVWALFLRAQT